MKTKKVIPTPASLMMSTIQSRFEKLKELQDKIASLKVLYKEHDVLMGELLPLFIEVYPDRIVTKREITVGTKVYRFTPFFYDEKKGEILTKAWKSVCHATGRITP